MGGYNPVAHVLREGTIVGLANHTLLIAQDGTERPIDDSGAPIKDHSGQLVGVVLVFRDITEWVAAEAALQASRDQFAVILGGARATAKRARPAHTTDHQPAGGPAQQNGIGPAGCLTP